MDEKGLVLLGKLIEVTKALMESPVEFEDERIKYKLMQVLRVNLEEAAEVVNEADLYEPQRVSEEALDRIIVAIVATENSREKVKQILSEEGVLLEQP